MQTIHDGFSSFFGLSSMITMSAIRGQRSPLLLCSFPWLQTWGKKEKLRQQLGSGVFSNLRESLCLDNIFLKTSISKPGKYLIALVKQLGRAPFTQTWFQTHDAGKLCGFQMKHSPWWARSGYCFVDNGKSREILKSGSRALWTLSIFSCWIIHGDQQGLL